MQRQRRRDSAPELALRSALHRRGLRFRVDRPVAGLSRHRVDIAFPRARLAVYVDGCFWHGCPEHGCVPKANSAWWQAKIENNRRRDARADALMRADGWTVLRVWEHEEPERAARLVAETYSALVAQR
jgi:DNA mismatch endonuclease, patch repair protein